jgi:hypothetical protein
MSVLRESPAGLSPAGIPGCVVSRQRNNPLLQHPEGIAGHAANRARTLRPENRINASWTNIRGGSPLPSIDSTLSEKETNPGSRPPW